MTTTGWTLALGGSVLAIALIAAAGDATLHLAAAGLIALLLTVSAVRENWILASAGASKNAVAASTARNNGLIWAWGALAILLTYMVVLERRWPEWWQFFLGFGLAAVGSMAYASAMTRDEAAGRVDPAIQKVGRGLIIAQVAGVIAALISMFVDGKFPRDIRYPDWAGCNIFFFGGVAILIVSLNALRSAR